MLAAKVLGSTNGVAEGGHGATSPAHSKRRAGSVIRVDCRRCGVWRARTPRRERPSTNHAELTCPKRRSFSPTSLHLPLTNTTTPPLWYVRSAGSGSLPVLEHVLDPFAMVLVSMAAITILDPSASDNFHGSSAAPLGLTFDSTLDSVTDALMGVEWCG
jgi:hypothetical protein